MPTSFKFFIFFSLILIVGCGQNTVEDSIKSIDSAIASNNIASAVIELKNAIQRTPDDSRLRLKLGRLYLVQNKLNSAEKELLKANELGADINEWLLPVVEVNYFLSNTDRIINLWDDHKGAINSLNRLNLDFYYALALINQNKRILALEILEKIQSQTTVQGNDEISLIAQSLLILFKENTTTTDIQQGLSILKQATIKYPNSKVAWLFYSKASSSNHNYEEAISSSKELAKLLPGYLLAEITVIESNIALQNYTSALTSLKAMLDSYPDYPYIWQLYAKVLLLSKDYEKANQAIITSIGKGLDNDESKIISGLSAFQLKNYEYSYTRLKSVAQSFSTDHPINRVLLSLEFKLYKKIESDRFKGSSGALVIQATNTLLSKKDNLQAKNIIENFKLSDVTSPKTALNIGRLKFALGDTEGLENFSALVDKVINKDTITQKEKHNIRELEIATLIQKNEMEMAQETLSRWISTEPSNISNYLMLIEINKKLNKPEKVSDLFKQIRKINPKFITAQLYFASQLLRDKQYSLSESNYLKIINEHEYNATAIYGYILSLEKQDKGAKAHSYISKLTNNNQLPAKIRLNLAQKLFQQKDHDKVLSLLANFSFDKRKDQERRHNILAATYIQTNNPLQAVGAYNKLLNIQPRNKKIFVEKIIALDYAKQYSQIIPEFKAFLQKFDVVPQEVDLFYAEYLVLLNKSEDALKILQSYKEHPISSARAYKNISATAFYGIGDYTKAEPLLLETYETNPTPSIATKIYNTYMRLGKKSDAIGFIKKHITENTDDALNRLIYAEYISKSDKNKAIIQYQLILKIDKTNGIALNNLSWIYYQQEQFDKAKSVINQAIELYPTDKNIIDTADKIDAAISKQS
jgi:putative PEP-CTERM system TPR-repeat lipoprotein